MLLTKDFIENSSESFSVNFEQLHDFLETVYGTIDHFSVAKQYIPDVIGLINMITKIYPFFTERSIKARYPKINRLMK